MDSTYIHTLNVLYPGIFWSKKQNDPASRLMRTIDQTNNQGVKECYQLCTQFGAWFEQLDSQLVEELTTLYTDKVVQYYSYRNGSDYYSSERTYWSAKFEETLSEMAEVVHMYVSNPKTAVWEVLFNNGNLVDAQYARMFLNIYLLNHSDYPRSYSDA